MKLDWMPEAAVSLRVAFWLLDSRPDSAGARVAIDGAHVRIAEHHSQGNVIPARTVCEVERILALNGCELVQQGMGFRGIYRRNGKVLTIRSATGADVLVDGCARTIRVECKGGALKPTKGKSATTILATVIGQLVVSQAADTDELFVAVPDSEGFRRAAIDILARTVFRKTGIQVLLVGEDAIRTVA
jgi:hypothetical protein